MREHLDKIYFGNTVEDYLWFASLLLLAALFKRVISRYLSRLIFNLIKKRAEGIEGEKLFELLRKPLNFLVLLVILFLATSRIEFPAQWELAPAHQFGLRLTLIKIYQMLIVYGFTWLAMRFIDFFALILIKKAQKTESKHDDQLIPFAKEIAKILVAVFGFFIILGSVFRLDVGSLIAGVGIGGLAIALAAKESLENLLASFTIFLDKPFVVGDLVQVGTVTGTVERVGFRSTRIRTLEKSYLTIPNRKMVDTELDNLTLRTFRRARFNIGLTYGTTQEQMNRIITELQQFIDQHPHTNQDGNVKFTEFGDSALNIMVEYFVDTMDWNIFLTVKEEINYKIMEIVKKHESDFAYPTTTVYLHKNS